MPQLAVWNMLRRGPFDAAGIQAHCKGGKEVWIKGVVRNALCCATHTAREPSG